MYCKKCGYTLLEDAAFCNNCGEPVNTEDNSPSVLDPNSASAPESLSTPVTAPAPETYTLSEGTVPAAPVYEEPAPEKHGNVLLGIIGALIGTVIGGASIVLFEQLGFISAFSGLIIAFCTLKGYEFLGKKLSLTGIIISIVLMLITPYFADRIDWAIEIVQAFPEENIAFIDAFFSVPALVSDEAVRGDYITNLLMLYGFTALGAFGTIFNAFKNRKH